MRGSRVGYQQSVVRSDLRICSGIAFTLPTRLDSMQRPPGQYPLVRNVQVKLTGDGADGVSSSLVISTWETPGLANVSGPA